jgi:hypothetical protein
LDRRAKARQARISARKQRPRNMAGSRGPGRVPAMRRPFDTEVNSDPMDQDSPRRTQHEAGVASRASPGRQLSAWHLRKWRTPLARIGAGRLTH